MNVTRDNRFLCKTSSCPWILGGFHSTSARDGGHRFQGSSACRVSSDISLASARYQSLPLANFAVHQQPHLDRRYDLVPTTQQHLCDSSVQSCLPLLAFLTTAKFGSNLSTQSFNFRPQELGGKILFRTKTKDCIT